MDDYLSIAEAASEWAEKNCPSGPDLLRQIEKDWSSVPVFKGTMAEALNDLKTAEEKQKRDPGEPGPITQSRGEVETTFPEGFAGSSVELKPLKVRPEKLREGALRTMRRKLIEQLIAAARAGKLTTRGRVTRLPLVGDQLASVNDEHIVSRADLRAYLGDGDERAPEAKTNSARSARTDVHMQADMVYLKKLELGNDLSDRQRMAHELYMRGTLKTAYTGEPMKEETIRGHLNKDGKTPAWNPPPVGGGRSVGGIDPPPSTKRPK